MSDIFSELLGDQSPHDRVTTYSIFNDTSGSKVTTKTATFRQLQEDLYVPRAATKGNLPLLKCGTFGAHVSEKGSLRSNENLRTITGVEGDYDGETISIEAAADMLRSAGIAAIVCSSPSYTVERPRWRVLCPLSEDTTPDLRETFVARINGALGGVLAGESFTASQTYFFGALTSAAPPITELVEGRAVDLATDLDESALGRDGKPFRPNVAAAASSSPADTFDTDLIAEALAYIPVAAADEADGRDLWRNIGMAIHHASGASDLGFAIWDEWSRPGQKYREKDQRYTWKSFKQPRGRPAIGVGTLITIAKGYGYEPRYIGLTEAQLEQVLGELDELEPLTGDPAAALRPKRLRVFRPADCAAEPSRGYIVKGLVAPGDVGCVYGAPGAGKSLISPHLGYAVARGVPAFGMRTKPGRVLYVAAEDARGMKDRVRALRIRHGDAPDFLVVDGVTDLLESGSENLAELRALVAELQPAMVFIDTLAMAFPGLEENAAADMGRVMAAATSLTKASNAAVILIHHDAKSQSPTPRGHSLLNGALDFALQLFPQDDSGIVRGRLSKNRNGPCDRDVAFRIEVERLGTDEDGDPITAALVAEIAPGSAPSRPKLPPSEAAALRVLFSLQAGLDGSYLEADWRAACIDGRSVSGSEDRDSRRKATDRAIQRLAAKGAISVRDGRIWPDMGASYQPDDLEP